eukprot:g1621.t1
MAGRSLKDFGRVTKKRARTEARKQDVRPDKQDLRPDKRAKQGEQVFLHKLLQYKRKGDSTLTPVMQKVFRFVARKCVVPDGFERSHKYGPLSGTCFEERLINAFLNEQLDLKDPSKSFADVAICTCCGARGHLRRDCPEAF